MSASPYFDERNVRGIIVITMKHALKGGAESALRDRLDGLARKGQQVLVDLGHLPYLDSSELGRLIRAHLSVRQSGGKVRLCNISEKVKTLMKLTRLDTVMELYDTEEEALKAMTPPSRDAASGMPAVEST